MMAKKKNNKVGKEVVDYWFDSSNDDLKTAKSLFKSKRYHHCLFFCHLFLEKTLKSLVVKKTKQQAPYAHNLSRLAELTEIKFSNEQLDLLAEITTFNVEARYNDYKHNFRKKATLIYTKKYFDNAKRINIWLKKKI